MDQALTLAQVAEQLQVSPGTVREWLVRGDLEGFQLPGGAWRVEPEAVEELKRRRRSGRERE